LSVRGIMPGAVLARDPGTEMVFLVGPPGFEPGFSAPKAGIERWLALVGADLR